MIYGILNVANYREDATLGGDYFTGIDWTSDGKVLKSITFHTRHGRKFQMGQPYGQVNS